MPFGENTRYDLVIDDRGTFSRVQCKTTSLRVEPTLDNQRKGIRYATDYAIGQVAIAGPRAPSGA
jgi:hypothetical protein